MRRGLLVLVVGAAASAAALVGCQADASGEPVTLSVWAHNGTDAEAATIRAQVADFNAAQEDVEVRLRLVPEGDYNDEVAIAAAGRDLPDVLDLDGPVVATQAHLDRLVPLDDLLPQSVLEAQLPTLRDQGRYQGATYAVASFESGLGLFADRSAFAQAGIDLPERNRDAWSADEFREVLARLAAQDPDGLVLDLKRNYGMGEWLTYGFAPLVASAGGELVEPVTLQAAGHLDGPATLRVLEELSSWAPYVDPNPEDLAFVERRVPLSWVGHWAFPAYQEALGDDLALVPLPDLGHGSRTGQGSWTWTVTARDRGQQEAAATFLEFLLTDEQVLRTTRANGAVPGTASALARSELYAEDGPLQMFAEQLLEGCVEGDSRRCAAVPRPTTPVYPVLSAEFARLVDGALRGEVSDRAAAEAARVVDEELALLAR